MTYVTIPDTTLKSSAFALGTGGFGLAQDGGAAHEMIELYRSVGGNHLDTAAVYPAGLLHKAEAVIGSYLKGAKGEFIIATKGGHPPVDNMRQSRLSREELTDDLDKSLDALGVPCVDLFYLHRDDVTIPVEAIMDTLAELVAAKKARYIGVSNWTAQRICAANDYAKKNQMPQIVASQIRYSLAKTNPQRVDDPTLVEMDEAEYAFYQASGMPVVAYSPQANGYFAKLEAGKDVSALARLHCPQNAAVYETAKQIADRRGVCVNAVVLGYLRSQPFPVVPILGASSPAQLAESLAFHDFALTAEELAQLESTR